MLLNIGIKMQLLYFRSSVSRIFRDSLPKVVERRGRGRKGDWVEKGSDRVGEEHTTHSTCSRSDGGLPLSQICKIFKKPKFHKLKNQ